MPLEAPEDVLRKTPIYRIVHIECLDTLVGRDALHAPSCVPSDGLNYLGIHAPSTQADRGSKPVPCGPGERIRDCVGFYLGPRSPMLFRVHTGWNVEQIDQSNIIYLVSSAQAVAAADLGFVFTDRHSLAAVASFFDKLEHLDRVDFQAAYAEQWGRNVSAHPDLQEKKQAEFLVHRRMPWNLIAGIGVQNEAVARKVRDVLARHPERHQPRVSVVREWYY